MPRLEVRPLRSQFPSTTCAHVTTVHFGVPVFEHDTRFACLYWPEIDRIGHHDGPSSPAFRAAARAALDAIWSAAAALPGVALLPCADHGQVDVSPSRVDHLDVLWPELGSLSSQPRPAGSARDPLLHVVPGAIEAVIDGLAERLGDRARGCRATELFGTIGPRLAARLSDVAVLPAPGREAWLRSAAGAETCDLGAHGGRDPTETSTYLPGWRSSGARRRDLDPT